MFDIETVADDLLARAEFCGGFVGYQDAMYECKSTFEAINEVIGKVTIWCDDTNGVAEWQSLLTREVLLTGGL